MHRFAWPFLTLCLAAGLLGPGAQGHPRPVRRLAAAVPLGPLPHTAIPARYRLTLTIDPRAARFRGHDEISVAITKPVETLYLHGLDLSVTRVFARLPGGATVKATYRQVDPSGVARLDFARRLPAGKVTLVFDYNAPFNPSLAGLYRVRRAGLDYAFTQFEATDARRMFPSFDEPGFKTPFDVIVNAPKADIVVANTPVASKNATGGGMIHWVFRRTAPLPTYLLALAVGPFDVVDGGTVPADKYRKRPIPLRGITAKGQGGQIRYALSLTPKIVMVLEHYFHIAYPFRKLDMIAVPDFSAGAMENAGAITFRERYLLMGPNAPLKQRRGSLAVQAHEITHQWFGDLVTPKWWDDIWLNESFAAWMQAKAAAIVMPKGEFGRETLRDGLGVMDTDELASARRIHSPVHGPGDIANIFDGITYSKGAAVLFMFEHYIGEAAWQKGIHAYLLKYAHRNASAREFIQTIARVTHHPEIVAAFNSYLNQAGVPDLSVALKCDGTASLSVTQAMYAQIGRTVPDRRWNVPMCVTGPNMKGRCRIVRRKTELMLGGTCPAYVMPNARGQGYYRFTYDAKGWTALIKAAPAMSPADQLALFANLDAALHADRAAPADLFAFVRAVAPSAQWDLIGIIANTFHGFRDHLLAAKDIPVYERFLRKTFAPRLRAVGLNTEPGEEPAVTLARAALVRLLVEEARDPQTLAALTKAAEAYLAPAAKRLDGISPDLVGTAMRAAVIEKGTTFGRRLVEAYRASDDGNFHREAVYALAGSTDTTFLDGVFDMALTPQMRIGDIRYFYYYMAMEPVARAALWRWLQANYDALLKRVTAEEMPRAAGLFTHVCDAHLRDKAEGFFRPKEKTVPGLKRRLDLARERIDRCIAFKDAKAKAVRAALLDTVK